MPQFNAGLGADYVQVTVTDGRILNYVENLPNTPLAAALGSVAQEMPADARTVWTLTKDTCFQLVMSSPTLAPLLGTAAIGDPGGDVFVELESPYDTSGLPTPWNDRIVASATYSLGGSFADPNSAPPC